MSMLLAAKLGRHMPAQKPHRSEQSVGTPRVFLDAVEKRFGKIDLDVAADHENTVANLYYTKEMDGLAQSWNGKLNWCNPPYSDITPWVDKARNEGAELRQSLLLLPASVGSNWWRDYVHRDADVYLLNGRLTFVGHTSPYPKDLVLLHFGALTFGYRVWDWRKDNLS